MNMGNEKKGSQGWLDKLQYWRSHLLNREAAGGRDLKGIRKVFRIR